MSLVYYIKAGESASSIIASQTQEGLDEIMQIEEPIDLATEVVSNPYFYKWNNDSTYCIKVLKNLPMCIKRFFNSKIYTDIGKVQAH